MGNVYKAKHLEMERMVAIKVLPPALSTNQFQERFNAEALAISKLEHQNIVSIYDYGQIKRQKYIAMQYIEGTTLAKVIKNGRKLKYSRIIHLAKQICRGIKYAHEKGVVHRDVKPGNIMLDDQDRAFLSDFGIAQTSESTRLTTTGMAMGTPEYMAPEQCEGKALDAQCDIYSLGIVLFEMVTGKPPFMGHNPLSIAYQQVHEVPPLVSKMRSDVPPILEIIIAKCLKKDQAERYKSINELLLDMDGIPVSRPSTKLNIPAVPAKKLERKITRKNVSQFFKKIPLPVLIFRISVIVLLSLLLSYCLYLHKTIKQLRDTSSPSTQIISQ